MSRGVGRRLAALLALAFALVPVAFADAQERVVAEAPAAQGKPRAATALRDREFGIATHALGLQRHVEMYQWRLGDDGRYRRVWWDRAIDSTAYDPAHRNPGAFPLETRNWIARDVTLDGKPVDDAVLKTLGVWRTFRPGFTALPGNLAATFQPEGDGLSSSENPLEPQVGDLRVTWRLLDVPRLADRIELVDGTWVVGADAPVAPSAVDTLAQPRTPAMRGGWLQVIGCVLLSVLVLLLLRARRRRASTAGAR